MATSSEGPSVGKSSLESLKCVGHEHGMIEPKTVEDTMKQHFFSEKSLDTAILHDNRFLDFLATDAPVTEFPAEHRYALILINKDYKVDASHCIAKLWKNASMRLCVDEGINVAENLHKAQSDLPLPTAIIGDLHRTSPAAIEDFKAKGVKIDQTRDEKYTDVARSLLWLLQYQEQSRERFPTIICYGSMAERFDKLMADVHALYKKKDRLKRVILLNEGSMIELLKGPAKHVIYCNKHFEGPGTEAGLHPIGNPVNCITTHGLHWDLANQQLAYGKFISTCNVITSERVLVDTSDDVIWTTSFHPSSSTAFPKQKPQGAPVTVTGIAQPYASQSPNKRQRSEQEQQEIDVQRMAGESPASPRGRDRGAKPMES